MKAFARLSAIHRIVCALIALALLAAPLQVANAAQPVVGMATSDLDCPEQQSCCDVDKADCEKDQSCLAKCGGAPGLALSDKVSGTFGTDAGDYFFVPVLLRPHASAPLRRPPRI